MSWRQVSSVGGDKMKKNHPMRKANETNSALLLYHLEKLGLENPVTDFQWLMDIAGKKWLTSTSISS